MKESDIYSKWGNRFKFGLKIHNIHTFRICYMFTDKYTGISYEFEENLSNCDDLNSFIENIVLEYRDSQVNSILKNENI